MFICDKCKNSDSKYIGYKNNQPYCRKCILLKTKEFENKKYDQCHLIKAAISYSLTSTQQTASNKILSFVKKGQSVLVNAVCGAGKTELMYATMEYFLNQGKKVGFCIPRKDVVIEIYQRLKKDYPSISIVSVYGSHTQELDGQIIVLTTYQLYRYQQHFDLLILDEADAFPYYNAYFLKRSTKGIIVYLSATFTKKFLKDIKNHVEVNRRFHQYDLPIPQIKLCFSFQFLKTLTIYLNKFNRESKQVLIFVPTRKIGKELSKKLNIPFVYSNDNQKQRIIQQFKLHQIHFLITTTILERGITIEDVQVIVYKANHFLFDFKTLVQISGRVGRKAKHPDGNIIFISNKKTHAMKLCIQTLKAKNATHA